MLIGRAKGMNWQLRVALSACMYMLMIFMFKAKAQEITHHKSSGTPVTACALRP
jgi:hypothetical protein